MIIQFGGEEAFYDTTIFCLAGDRCDVIVLAPIHGGKWEAASIHCDDSSACSIECAVDDYCIHIIGDSYPTRSPVFPTNDPTKYPSI